MIPARSSLLALAVIALAALPAAAADAPPAPGDDPDAKARAWFTDTELLTQDGAPVRFYGDVLQGRTVVIGFVFSRCVGACPLILSKLKRVQEGLGELFAEEVSFVLVSVDPEFDTPRELRRLAEKHRAGGKGWTYLTGRKEDVSLVLKRLGSYVDDPGEHNTGFVAANVRTRHWIKVHPQLPPAALVEQLRELAREDRAAGATAAAR